MLEYKCTSQKIFFCTNEAGLYISFYHHLPITNIKKKNSCPNDIFTCPKKKKLFVVLIVVCPQYTFSLPDSAAVISWSFEMLARIWLLLAPGSQASAYVAPWLKVVIALQTIFLGGGGVEIIVMLFHGKINFSYSYSGNSCRPNYYK